MIAEDLAGAAQIAETQMREVLRLMEKVYSQFLQAAEEFLNQWFLREASERVREKFDLTRDLGKEKLAEMKTEVRALQGETSSMIQEYLTDSSLWWHKKQDEQDYVCEGQFVPPKINYALRLIAGRLAPILEKYGYLILDLENPGSWRECSKIGLYYFRHARPFYHKALDWSPRMKSLMTMYHKLHTEGLYHKDEIDRLRQGIATAEAETLWSQV